MKDTIGKLYVIPTPIGNLEDITLRAKRLLQEVDYLLAEDTRTTGKLLSHLSIDQTLRSYHLHNEHKIVQQVVDDLIQGKNIGLVSDAGTPAISDPGFLLVREALKNNINVETLPGATAFVPALVNSGLPCEKFIFEGFIPSKKGKQTKLKEILDHSYTTVFYESPHRVLKTIIQLIELGDKDRMASFSREISKLYEESFTGTLEEIKSHLESKQAIKGEFVVVIAGKNYTSHL